MTPPTPRTRRPADWRRRLRSFGGEERGEFLASALVLITGVLLVIGFTVDAGRLLAARRSLTDTASQAAIAGAQHPDEHGFFAGQTTLGPGAVTAANAYLTGIGVDGSATVAGDLITVSTRSEFVPILFFGFTTQTVSGTSTARAVRGVDNPET